MAKNEIAQVSVGTNYFGEGYFKVCRRKADTPGKFIFNSYPLNTKTKAKRASGILDKLCNQADNDENSWVNTYSYIDTNPALSKRDIPIMMMNVDVHWFASE